MPVDIDQFIEKLPKERRDWLEVWGNQWGEPTKVMPGTCEACVWGSGSHTKDCALRQTVAPFRALGSWAAIHDYIWQSAMDPKTQGILNAYQHGQIETK